MKKFKSLRTKLIPIIIFIAVIPIIIASTFSIISSNRLVTDKVNELTSQVALEKAAYVDEYITGAENQAESLSFLLENMNSIGREEVLSTVKSIKDSNDSLLFGYMGTENKEMYIYPSTNLAADYDPTQRQWYKDAIAGGGKIVMTKPYKSASTGKYIVTLAKQIKLKDGRTAVSGLDVEILKLMESIANTKVGESGHAILLLQDGTILAHPDKELIMQNITEKFSWGKDVINKKSGNMKYKDGKINNIAGISLCSKTGWIVEASLPESEYGKQLAETWKTTLLLVLIVIAVSIVVGLWIIRYITKPLLKLSNLMSKAENGDYTINIESTREDEIGQIVNSFKNLIESQKRIISNIVHTSGEILESSEKMLDISKQSTESMGSVKASIGEIASSSEQNAAGVEEANAGVEEMASNAQTVAMSAEKAREFSEKSVRVANDGYQSVDKAAESMELIKQSTRDINKVVNELYDSSMKIDTIVKTITSIASQTNLLALNAAIEAARAGESGRGFAVVADEVRKLAEESSSSAKHIENLIEDIQNKVNLAVESTEKEMAYVEDGAENTLSVKDALNEILESIRLVDNHIEEVAAASQEQSASSEEMAAVINNISVSIEENVKSTEEVSSAVEVQNSAMSSLEEAAEGLEELSLKLSKEIEGFKI